MRSDAILTTGTLWLHQREQWDSPVPEGWYVCHEDYVLAHATGTRRVAVGPDALATLSRGAANAARWPAGVADVPDEEVGYPPQMPMGPKDPPPFATGGFVEPQKYAVLNPEGTVTYGAFGPGTMVFLSGSGEVKIPTTSGSMNHGLPGDER